ncbi:isoleucine-tRNA ligase [Microbotryomycetes sp. JL221]|nr:isoleucine-tRNA ligase [Microbotryomycetes sp. JL221]
MDLRHALNKITKDIINRSKLIQGYRIHYVPGYDTHGLPLELKALSTLDKPASQLSPQTIRQAARQEALRGIQTQGKEFRSFACIGAFEDKDAYKTMDWSYERRQLGVVKQMVQKGLITSHHRPTLYSPSSRTALAEAELEYRDDHVSRSVYVAFPVDQIGASLTKLMYQHDIPNEALSLAAWTTTAWTLPSNKAIAIAPDLEYAIVRMNSNNKLIVMATERISTLEKVLQTSLSILIKFKGSILLDTTYFCPLSSNLNRIQSKPVIAASHVTSGSGTGLVHTAPAHGIEDWQAWRDYTSQQHTTNQTKDENIICAVDSEGKLSKELYDLVDETTADKLLGKDVLSDGTNEVIKVLQDRQTLLKEVEVQHKFPYDWRTKKPVIYRTSSQWFANVENVKQDAINAISNVTFVPERGSKTLEMFIRGRSEWCISRQRAWGVPIPVVYKYHKDSSDPIKDSKPLLTPTNIEHIIQVLDKQGKGTDYWWQGQVEEFVEPDELFQSKQQGFEWRKGLDTMDVWFDSGCSWTMLSELNLRNNGKDGKPLADVYLEGSDQHRGWFQSSLLTHVSATTSVNNKVKAPYGTVITHGMVLDEQGRKMSKSLGNILSPSSVIKGGKNLKQMPAYGTDLLRVWVASVDWTKDVLIGPSILAQTFETLKKMRNTARFMLGNIVGSDNEQLSLNELSIIDRYVLHELFELDSVAREAYNTYAFSKVWQALATYTNTILAFYFDVVKDTLYADSKNSIERRRVIFTLQNKLISFDESHISTTQTQKVLKTYTQILAPMAPLLSEEIHHFLNGSIQDPKIDDKQNESIFKHVWKPIPQEWYSIEVKNDMTKLLDVRDQVMVLLELARTEKLIGSSTEADVYLNNPDDIIHKYKQDLKSLFIVSNVYIDSTNQIDTTTTTTRTTTTGPHSTKFFTNSNKTIKIVKSLKLKCPRCWLHMKEFEHEETCDRCQRVLLQQLT